MKQVTCSIVMKIYILNARYKEIIVIEGARFSRCIYFRRVQSHRDTNFAIACVILNEENGDLNYNCTRRSGIKRASCYNIIATCVSSVLSYRCRVYIRDYINGQLCH